MQVNNSLMLTITVDENNKAVNIFLSALKENYLFSLFSG